jgi:MATE family multidrug resistance protein
MSYGIDGFAFASESLVGKYFGAMNKKDFYRSIKLSFIWSFSMAIVLGFIYWIAGERLLQVFTDQMDVILSAKPYLIWMIIFPVVGFACYIWDGIFIGMTASVAMRNTMAIALVFYIISYHILVPRFQNHGLWLTLLIFLAARGLLQWAVFVRKKIQLK